MIADTYTQLVFHVLAHVRLTGPGDLFDRRYIDWAAERFSAEDTELLAQGATWLACVWAMDPRCDQLHRFCDLHRDVAELLAHADRSLIELHPHEVADPALLEAVRELEGAELLHASLAVLAPRFTEVIAEQAPALERARVSVGEWLACLAEWCPGLADTRVELVWALGPHGRALPGRCLVGAPTPWSGCSSARQAVLAAHEHAVTLAGSGDDYVGEEWTALTELATWLERADPELRAAHGAWLASLELGPLLAEALARELLTAADAEALTDQPYQRAERLIAARAAAPR